MTTEPSYEERLALEVIKKVEEVDKNSWVPTGDHPTPDISLTLCDGRFVTVEVTRHVASGVAAYLGAISKRNYTEHPDLLYRWVLGVEQTKRRLQDIEQLIIEVLKEVEACGGSQQEILHRARKRFDWAPYRQPGWYSDKLQEWDKDKPPQTRTKHHFHQWLLSWLEGNTDYWCPEDVLNYYQNNITPQHIFIYSCEPSSPGGIGYEGFAWLGESTSPLSGQLKSAVQSCIEKKARRGQFNESTGYKWLVVVLHHTSIGSFYSSVLSKSEIDISDYLGSEMSGLDYMGIDEVWVVGEVNLNEVLLIRLPNLDVRLLQVHIER